VREESPVTEGGNQLWFAVIKTMGSDLVVPCLGFSPRAAAASLHVGPASTLASWYPCPASCMRRVGAARVNTQSPLAERRVNVPADMAALYLRLNVRGRGVDRRPSKRLRLHANSLARFGDQEACIQLRPVADYYYWRLPNIPFPCNVAQGPFGMSKCLFWYLDACNFFVRVDGARQSRYAQMLFFPYLCKECVGVRATGTLPCTTAVCRTRGRWARTSECVDMTSLVLVRSWSPRQASCGIAVRPAALKVSLLSSFMQSTSPPQRERVRVGK